MRLKTTGLGLITIGILLLGAQLVLYLGARSAPLSPGNGEVRVALPRQVRTTPLAGIVGAMSLIAGLALSARRSDEPDDPGDGFTIPEEAQKAGQTRQEFPNRR